MTIRFLKRKDFLNNTLVEAFDLESKDSFMDKRSQNKVKSLLESAKATIISIEEAKDLVTAGAIPLGETTIKLLSDIESN